MRSDCPAPGGTAQLRQRWREAFQDGDDVLDSFFSTAFSPRRCRCVLLDGRLAAALYWFDCRCRGERMAYLYAVATAKEFRGRGLCRALISDTHAHLRSLGYAGTLLVPAAPGLFGMYAGMGYLPGTRVRELECSAPAEPVELCRIDAQEYARLREKLLPPGSVRHGDAALSYLQDQYLLYRGKDFLLAAEMTAGGILRGEELLGSAAAVPGILGALGALSGVFRTPGGEKLYSMYCPLAPRCPAPEYFGLAF